MPLTLLEEAALLLTGEYVLSSGVLQRKSPANLTPQGTTTPTPTAPPAPRAGEGQSRVDVPAPPQQPQCKGIGQGFVPLTADQVLSMITPPASVRGGWQQFIKDSPNLGKKLYDGMLQAIATETIPIHPCTPPVQQGRSKLYTNAERNIPGLNTIIALPAGSAATTKAIGAIPEVGTDLNFALTTSPRGLVSPATAGEISSIGQRTGSTTLGSIGASAALPLAVASIVLGFEEDGVIGGIANLLSTVAYFDPEPISRVVLTVVGAVFGQIFAHHKQRVAVENAVECATTPAISEALGTVDKAVMDGRVFPEHGSQLLDHLYNEFQDHLNKYNLIKRNFNTTGGKSWSCNAGCELLLYLQAINIKKKDRYARLTNVPCPPPPIIALQAQPQIYVNPAVVTVNEKSVDSTPVVTARPPFIPRTSLPPQLASSPNFASLYRLYGGKLQ